MKRLNELDYDECVKVIENNGKLESEIYDLVCESEFFFIREMMNKFTTVYNWNCDGGGIYTANVKVHESYYPEFVRELVELDDEYGILTEDDRKTADRLYSKHEFYDDCMTGYVDISEQRFRNLEKWFDGHTEHLIKALENYIDAVIDGISTTDYLADFIYNIFADDHPEIYVDKTYTAYQYHEYVECFA